MLVETGWIWTLFAAFAVLVGVSALAVPIYYSNLPARWDNAGMNNIWFGKNLSAQTLVNPYNLRVAEYENKYVIVRNTTSDDEIDSLSTDPNFKRALSSDERFVLYRGGARSVIFASDVTLKEALTLSRSKVMAEALARQTAAGVYVLDSETVLGRSWLGLVGEYWFLIILGAALLYAAYVIFFTLIMPKNYEDEEKQDEPGPPPEPPKMPEKQ